MRPVLTLSVYHSEGGVIKFDGHRQEQPPVALCGASWVSKSVAEGAHRTNQCIVEWVGGVVQDPKLRKKLLQSHSSSAQFPSTQYSFRNCNYNLDVDANSVYLSQKLVIIIF